MKSKKKKKRVTKKERLKKVKQKYILTSIFSIIITAILLIGSIKLSINDTIQKKIVSGDVILKLDQNTSEGIILRNAIPLDIEKGKKEKIYKFTIENESQSTNQYKILLDDQKIYQDEQRMKDKNIKYRLIENNQKETVDVVATLLKDHKRVLVSGKLKPKEKKTYQLQVWLDIDAESFDEDAVFNAKLKIETIKVIN